MSFLSGRSGVEKRLMVLPEDNIWGEDRYQPETLTLDVNGRTVKPGVVSSRQPAQIAADKITCANPNCSGSWTKPWRSRRRPLFEEQWGCTPRCLQAIIRGAVRRESGDGIAVTDETPHRHRVPLGLVMLAKGWITQPQLRQALEDQRAKGGRIGEWLQHDCGLQSHTITRGLSLQWNCPVLTTEAFEPEVMARVMPRLFVDEFGLLPLRIAASRMLYLAFEDRLDASAAFSLQKMTDLRVESGLVEAEALREARERLLQCEFVPCDREALRDSEQMIASVVEILNDRQPIGARLVRFGRFYWLRMWLETGAQGSSGTVPVGLDDIHDVTFRLGS